MFENAVSNAVSKRIKRGKGPHPSFSSLRRRVGSHFDLTPPPLPRVPFVVCRRKQCYAFGIRFVGVKAGNENKGATHKARSIVRYTLGRSLYAYLKFASLDSFLSFDVDEITEE
ncbi:hypothetical protein NPIL_608301 [Nephila pilipes]|uniref:Uncharacterized protein n=1 Tax=Nephila pilipes TaxID=299642 RepID=A0A8X6MWG8_NEPPI|nr:hypothetical protein NPIL_608301 [Nephila pilipes]